MDGSFKKALSLGAIDLEAPLQRILDLQTPQGAIPWFEDGPWDPWNHVESAMALTVTRQMMLSIAVEAARHRRR